MEQHQGMNGAANEESSNADEVRSAEQKSGLDSRDVDMKPASPGSHTPATTPTTPEASKKSSKRGKIRVRLNLFNKRRKAASLESPPNTDGVLFGQNLATICLPQPAGALPRPLIELLRTLYVNGPTAEGIFRRCPSKTACRSVRKQLESGIDCGPIDVHIASSLLAELLRELPDCLLCCRMYDQWLESSSKTDQEDRISSLRQLVGGLPQCNLLLLRHLICVLRRIDRSSEQTKMTSRNLALCLGPSLLWSKTTTLDNQAKDVDRTAATVKALIDHAPDIFGLDCLELFRDCDSYSITALSTDHQAADAGIESADRSPPQCARGSNDLPTTSLSQANVLAPTLLEPPPVAPPRRKRSSVVAPPTFVCIAEESTSEQSATPIPAKQVIEDKRLLSRSLSSDSEVSCRDWPVKNYGTETTDGETVEDSDETSATEEDLDGQRSSMLSEDLADEEDSSMGGLSVERPNDMVNIQERRKSGGTPTAIERNLSKLSSSLTSPPSAVKSNRSTEGKQEKTATIGLMSFSSTEESIAGDRGATSKPLFFGSSFSSTAGSDADLSTFTESLDSGMALSESNESPCGIRGRKQLDMDGVSNSSAATIPLSLQDYHNREFPTVAYNTHDRKYIMSKHQRMSQINDKRDLESPAKATANTGGEHGTHATSDSAVDVCDSGITSVTNDSGRASYHRASQVTDTSDQPYAQQSTQTPDTSGQSALLSRRHSFGCRDPGNVADLYETQARQLRGMTHKGSDVFPGKLPKTLGSRATRVYDQSGRECKSLSGAKSDNEAGGTICYSGKKLTPDERIIVSDIEFSESTEKTHNAPRRGHRTAKGCQNLDSPGASRLPLANQDGRQLDRDEGGFNTAQTTLMEVTEEDKEKNSNARRLPLEPPDYDEAVKQLQSKQKTDLVSSLADKEESILQAERQKEGERTKIKENEKKKQPDENYSTRQRRPESVGIEDASALAQLAARSCGDLFKAAELNATDDTSKFPKSEQGSELKHVRSLGALTSGDSLRKRFCIPRSQRWGIRDSSSSSSSKSNSDEEATLLRQIEDNLAKKRVRRKKCRRSRKARNSDTRLQTDRENRVNLVRSKSDSNTLLRELIVKQEDAEHVRETFRKEISRRRADQKTSSKDVFQDRQELDKENQNNGAIRVKYLVDDDRIGYECELTSTTREGNRKSVALKDREWHKDLVREVESTQKSQSSRYSNSGTEGKLQRKTKDSCSHSANKLKNSNNTGKATFTIPGASTCISKTRHGKLLDYSSSDSTKRSTDDTTHISDSGERCLGKICDEEFVSCGGSGGDGSEGSTTNFNEFRANQLKKSDRDFQDASRSKETIAKKCAPKEDHSSLVNARGNFLGVKMSHQRTNTLCSDIEHGSTRDRFKGKADTQPSREFTAQPIIKSKEDEDDVSEKTSSNPCKSSTSQFERISVKDIVAMKNSSSGSASSKKPPLPSSSRRGEEGTEAWRPETGKPVARRASHVTPQVKSEVEISLTPELSRKTPPRTEQKPASIPSKNSSETNRLPLPVRSRSHSVKYLNVRETEVERKKNVETTFPRPSQSTAADASTSDASQRQRLAGSSKSPWQKTLTSLSGKSSHESTRSDDLSTDSVKALLKSDAEVCPSEKGEKKIDCGESATGQSVCPSQGYDSVIDNSTKTEMPWSVANLRSKYRYGNQNPQ